MPRNRIVPACRRFSFFAIACGFVLLPLIAWAQQEPHQGPEMVLQEYRIGVGDVIVTSVRRSPDLTVTVPVRPDGRIGFPLIGEVLVASRTPAELQELLSLEYAKYVTAPQVSVVVQEIQSRKVFMLGEVNSPGVYDIMRPTRLLQALAMAGGMTEYAKRDKVVVLRETASGFERLEVSVKAITAGRSLEDNLVLLPGDTIVVP